MELAAPFLALRGPRSHGFRAGYQSAEAHSTLRHIVAKRAEWGMRTTFIKLDMAKAYDTMWHSAVDELFEQRQLPMALRAANWREHLDRRPAFRTCDGNISFSVRPARGMPQGAHENAMIYAAIIEDTTTDGEERLVRQRLPTGARAHDDLSAFDVERDTNARRPFRAGEIGFLNFADDQYVLASDTLNATFMVSELAEDMAAKRQVFNEGKSEWLDTYYTSTTPPPRV